MSSTLRRQSRCIGTAALLGSLACGPVVALDGDAAGSSGDGGPSTDSPSAVTTTTATTTGPTVGEESASTGDDDPCAQFGSCPLCHEGFLLQFFAVGGLEARALLPTAEGGLVAVGTMEDPGAITWLDGDGNPSAQAGPYAEGLELQSATWGPDGGLILAGSVGQALWVGITDASGSLLRALDVASGEPPTHNPVLPDIRVNRHEFRGVFLTAHYGSQPPLATGTGVTQLNYDLEYRHGFYVVADPFTLDLSTRGGATVTSTDMLYASSYAGELGLRLLRRSIETPWNVVQPESSVVDVPGLPASITALHGDAIVTASNDDSAHIARIDGGEHLVWHRALSVAPVTRADRVGFDATSDLLLVAGAVGEGDGTEVLWIAALDEDGEDVWAFIAPPELEDASTPVLDVVGLPDGGVAISTAGNLWYALVLPYAC
jgi:hypothetical protein